MRRFIFERLRSSILRPAAPGVLTRLRPKLRHLICEPLEDRRLLSGVTFVTHGAQGLGDDPQLPSWVAGMAEEVAVQIGDAYGGAGRECGSVQDDRRGSGQRNPRSRAGNFPAVHARCGRHGSHLRSGQIRWRAKRSSALTGRPLPRHWKQPRRPLPRPFRHISSAIWPRWAPISLASPIHLIGHSRGASSVGALAEDLGQAGIWVDQVTYLDTHPLEFSSTPTIGATTASPSRRTWFLATAIGEQIWIRWTSTAKWCPGPTTLN